MYFRSLTLFKLPPSLTTALEPAAGEPDSLNAALSMDALQPIGTLERECYGFVAPLNYGDDPQLTHRLGRHCWITLGAEKKLLTAGALNREVTKRMQAAQDRMGLKISSKQARAFKEEALAEMLPKAFVQAERCDAYLDFERRFLIVDHTSRKVAEGLVSHLRAAIGSFPAIPTNAEVAPRAILTAWLAGEVLPDGLSLGEECELRDGSTSGPRVKFSNAELRSDEVEKHLEAGMQCVRLGLVLDDHVSFTIGEDLVVRKLKFLDGALEALDEADRDSVRQEMDARFAMMTGEIGRLLDVLQHAFKLSPLDDASGPAEPAVSKQQRAPRKAKAPKLEGVESVTITATLHDSSSSVTLTAEQFSQLGATMEQYDRAVAEVRAEGLTSESHLARVLGVSPSNAAGLLSALEATGVITAANVDGIHHLVNGELELPEPTTIFGHPEDDAYNDAVAHVRKTRRPSISGVQRALGIGYNRAARLLETMEERGVVSPPDHRGDRKVL